MTIADKLKRRSGLGLALLGGLLVGLSGEPWSVNALAFLGLGCLVASFARAETEQRPRWHSVLSGFAFGGMVNAIALGSVVDLLEQFGHFSAWLAWPTAALCWVAQGLPYAVAGALVQFTSSRGVSRLWAFPPSLTLALGLTPQLFPWHVGTTQVDFLWFAQIADLGGEALLDLMLGICAVSLVELTTPRDATRRQAAMALVCALILPCIYGALRLSEVRTIRSAAPRIRVGITQPNVDIDEKHDLARRTPIMKNLLSLTRTLEQRGADLTIWPETAYPYFLARTRRVAPTDQRAVLADGVRGPVVLGLVSYETLPGGAEQRYNTAWLVDRDGKMGDRVDKTHLLAFGEFIPFWHYLPPLQKRFASPGFARGVPDVISAQGVKFGILICYEDLFASQARGTVQRGAEALINMTNVAWFRRGHVPALHDMMAHLRAIETRRDFARSVNTGVSSLTLATGETLKTTSIFTRTGFVADMRKLSLPTLYVKLGDWLTPLCGVLLIGLVLRKRKGAA